MRMLVTGRTGQVVRSLMARAPAGVEVAALGRPELDLAHPEGLAAAMAALRPDVVVSAAAYTAVDRAEVEPALAQAVNGAGAGAVAAAAALLGVPLIHLSSDYVFDGTKRAPYVESDQPAPINIYGATKWAGEQAVIAAHPGAVVVRTSWLYSPFGANFLTTMLRLADERRRIDVVSDQIGCPTSALDLADGLWAVAARLCADPAAPRGVFHMAGHGKASWAEVAEELFDVSSMLGGPYAKVKRIGSAQYPAPARRPADSRLDCSALAAGYDVRLPDWRRSLQTVTVRLVAAMTMMEVAA